MKVQFEYFVDGVNIYNFDFAFIDGDHTGDRPAKDFELVKKCGRVLFHDRTREAVKAVIDALPKDEVEIMGGFAYWERKL